MKTRHMSNCRHSYPVYFLIKLDHRNQKKCKNMANVERTAEDKIHFGFSRLAHEREGDRMVYQSRWTKESTINLFKLSIVLISLSGGCTTSQSYWRCPQDQSPNASEAALLITNFDGTRCTDGREDAKVATIIEIDSKEVLAINRRPNIFFAPDYKGSTWAELSPGYHRISFKKGIPNVQIKTVYSDGHSTSRNRDDFKAIATLDKLYVEKQHVYRVVARFNNYDNPTFTTQYGNSTRESSFTTGITTTIRYSEYRNFDLIIDVVECVGYTYDSTSGIAKNSTDSRLSFKVK